MQVDAWRRRAPKKADFQSAHGGG